jgi:hypothetical protein
MALPQGTARLKIHPAIGFARVSTSPNSYVFGDPHPQETYKSGKLIKRQAVQFRIFAYDANNVGLAELTPASLAANGLRAVWHARVANRKTARGPESQNNDAFTIEASARSDVNGGLLSGRCGDFPGDGQNVQLGEIRSDGRIIPPLAQMYSRNPGAPIPPAGMWNKDFADNVSDGVISVELIDQGTGRPLTIPVLEAWIVVAPPDFAPDWDDLGANNLENRLIDILNLPNQTPAHPVNRAAREIDRLVLKRGTAHFGPGIEIANPVPEMFHSGAAVGDPDEVRVRPGASFGGPGTTPGEMTLGLCSPWQFDFRACTCSNWPNQRPDTAFRENANGAEIDWLRRYASEDGVDPPGGQLETNADFVRHVYELGLVRREGDDHVEKERSNDIPPEVA